MINWFHKTLPKNNFYALLEMILHLDKQDLLQYMLDITFPKKMWLGGQKGGL